MTKYPFLSDEWVAEARAIRAEYADRTPTVPVSVRMNQVIRNVPFGDGVIHAHLDTSSGDIDIEVGHLDLADVTITVDYETAKALLLGGDPGAAMQAFMSGRIKVEGDIGKLLGLQSAGMPGGAVLGSGDAETAGEVARRLLDMTE